jgi:hypothetical protein
MATPVPGLAWQTPDTAGQPINAIGANMSGGYVSNPPNAPGPLYVDPTGPASNVANGTTIALPPGQPYYVIPQSTLPISVASDFPNHNFVSVQWP